MSVDDTLKAPFPTTIYVVRHAHVHNPKDILYGRLPRFHLSRKGMEQAAETARFLSTRDIAAIYTSPLLRARQTAHVLSQYHPAATQKVSEDLIEVRTAYQGSPNSILKPGFSFYEPQLDPSDETMPQIFLRMMRFLRRVARRHSGKGIVAVSHADPITVMRVGLENRELTTANLHSTVYPARSSVTQLSFGGNEELRLTYIDVAREGAG